jgi:hypothetical protein
MKKKWLIKIIPIIIFLFIGCEDDDTNIIVDDIEPEVERVGFELIEIVSLEEILVWMNNEPLTQEEFDSIKISANWSKNQPREGDPDGSTFFRSPDASRDGEFTIAEHFGYQWLFNAQIVEQNVPLSDNEDGLLNGRYIAKYHRIQFNAGKTIFVLISPDGEEYVRISRDLNRMTDTPIIPDTWQIEEREVNENLTIDLPNPTLNIRAENNQDSFQGPIVF